MPECDYMKEGRSQVEPDYPTKGINFRIWDQEAIKGDQACTKGIYYASSDFCYKYKIMTQVCAMVKFRQDPETNTYSWLYTGGCYKDGDPVHYEDAEIGQSHSFKDVQFEVRMDHRDWS